MSNADRLLNKYNPNHDEKGRFAGGDGGGGAAPKGGGLAEHHAKEKAGLAHQHELERDDLWEKHRAEIQAHPDVQFHIKHDGEDAELAQKQKRQNTVMDNRHKREAAAEQPKADPHQEIADRKEKAVRDHMQVHELYQKQVKEKGVDDPGAKAMLNVIQDQQRHNPDVAAEAVKRMGNKAPKAERDTGGRGIIEGPHKDIKLRHKDEVDALQVEQGKRYDALRAKGASPDEWQAHRDKMTAENKEIRGRHQKELRAARRAPKP